MKKLILSFTILSSVSAFASPLSPHMRAAEEAYRRGNVTQTVQSLREALIEHKNHPLVVAQSTRILSKLTETKSLSESKVDWKLPKEFDSLRIEIRRRYSLENGRVRYQLIAAGGVNNPATLEKFQLVRYPDTVIIDKQAKIGDWQDEVWTPQIQGFWSTSERQTNPILEGLYLVNIKITGQDEVHGWVILSDMNSSASPVVEKPTINQEFTTPTPKLFWRRFVSPEFKPEKEVRRLRIAINQNTEPDYKDVMSADFKGTPDLTSFVVGDVKTPHEYEGEKSLTSGRYLFTLHFSERSAFGDVTLSRASVTAIPFSVK